MIDNNTNPVNDPNNKNPTNDPKKDVNYKPEPGVGSQRKPPGHEELASYFSPRSVDMTTEDVLKRITTDAKAFESSLRMYYDENSQNLDGRDFLTFRAEYIDKYGDPFGKPKKQPGEEKTEKPVPANNNLFSWQEGAQETPLASASYAEQGVDSDFNREAYEEYITYQDLTHTRGDDYTTTADDHAINKNERPEYLKAKLNSQTISEKVNDNSPAAKEYNYRTDAIKSEIDNIDTSMSYLMKALKGRYGEGFIEEAEKDEGFLAQLDQDEQFTQWRKLADLRAANVNKFIEINADGKYWPVLAGMQLDDARQVERDVRGNVADPTVGVQNFGIRLLGKTIAGLGAIGEMGEELLSDNNTYGATDYLWDYLQEADDYGQKMYPKLSKNARSFVTSTSDYELAGKPIQVDFDQNGEIISVRHKDGSIIPNAMSMLTDEDIASIKQGDKRQQFNWGPGVISTLETVGDLAVQVAVSKGVAGGLGKLGATKRVSDRMGVTASVMVQTAAPLLDEGKELFPDDPDRAAMYALTSSMMIGLSSNLFGLESKLAGGTGGLVDDIFASKTRLSKLKSLAKGKAPSPRKLAAAATVGVVKAGLGESFEEVVLEGMLKNSSKLALGENVTKEVDWNQVIETAAISFAVGLMGGVGNVSSEITKSALDIAIEDPYAFRSELARQMEKPENLSRANTTVNDPQREVKVQEYVASETAKIEKIRDNYKVVAPMVKRNVPRADVLEYIAAVESAKVNVAQQKLVGVPTQEAEYKQAAISGQIDKLQKEGEPMVPVQVIENNDISAPIQLPNTPEAPVSKQYRNEPAQAMIKPSGRNITLSPKVNNNIEYFTYPDSTKESGVNIVQPDSDGNLINQEGQVIQFISPSPVLEQMRQSGDSMPLDELIGALDTIFPKTSQVIRAKFDALRDKIRKGDDAAKVELMNEAESLRQQVRNLAGTDNVENARDKDASVTAEFDKAVENINATAQAKGIESPLDPLSEMTPGDVTAQTEKVNSAEYVLPEVVGEDNIGAATNQLNAIEKIIKATPDDVEAKKARKKLKRKIKAYERRVKERRQMRMDNDDTITTTLVQDSKTVSDVEVNQKRQSVGFHMSGGGGFIKMLYGLAGGKTPVELKIALDKFKAIFRKNTVGNLPKTGLNLNIDRISAINAHMKRGEIYVKQLKRAIKGREKGKRDIRDVALNKDLNRFMKDPDLTDTSVDLTYSDGSVLEPEVRQPLIDMRNHIDELSRMLISSGVVDGPLADVITDNMTVYLHRSYQIHNDPDWVEKVSRDPDIWNPGVAWWEGVLNEEVARLESNINNATKNRDKLIKKLETLDELQAPKTYADTARKIEYYNDRIPQLEDDLDIAKAKVAVPAASLSAHLKEKSNPRGSGSQLGAKDMGIFQMRGGKTKKRAVKKANKAVKKAKDEFQEKQETLNNLLEKGADEMELTQAKAEVDSAWEKVSKAEAKLGEALDMDIPEELRKLYGEYDSSLMNYMHTIYKQSALAANHKFLNQIQEVGLRDGWLYPSTSPQPGFDYKIAADSSSVMSPLNGLYTSAPIKEAFEKYNQAYNLPSWISAWVWASGTTKKWLTVYSPVGHIRNIVSGGYFHALSGDFLASPAGIAMYANGVLQSIADITPGGTYVKNNIIGESIEKAARRLQESEPGNNSLIRWVQSQSALPVNVIDANKQAFRIGRDAKVSDKKEIAMFEELVGLGLTDESVSFGLIKDSMEQFRTGFISPYTSIGPGQDINLGRTISTNVNNFAQGTYQASDTAHRILRYMRDLQRYANSRGISQADLAPGKNMEFKREISEIARRTYPTYSRMPKIVSALGKSPLIGPFISFHYTAAEAAVNNVDQSIKDFRNGDTGIGLSRLLGLMLSNVTYGLALKGVGAVILGNVLGITTGTPEDEDEDDNKWTYFLPEWSKYSKVTVFPTGGGNFKYVDHGSQIPNAVIFETIESLMQGNFKRATESFEKEIVGPFVSPDVFTKTALEALLNKKNLDAERKLYHGKDSFINKVEAGAGHIIKRVMPGLFNTLSRLYGAYNNEMGNPNYEDYKDYDLGVEMIVATTGLRVSNGDAGTSFGYSINNISAEFNQALSLYRTKARTLKREFPGITKRERMKKLDWQYKKAEELAQKSAEDALNLYTAGKAAGVPRKQLDEMLTKSGLPPITRDAIKRGRIKLPEIDSI
jgi:hypothetical protein